MPIPNRIPGTPQAWLARAKSNLAIAMMKKPEEAYYEDYCFNAQQAAEKALKAILQHNKFLFRYVHDLEVLITILEKNNVLVPDEIKECTILTQYALETRYPGDFEPVEEEEYQKAVELAQKVVHWAEMIIEKKIE